MRQTLPFSKYHGTGNDFILVDNRDSKAGQLSSSQILACCHRRFGVGADGFILLEDKPGYDFEMIYYNSDGKLSSMCGNGGRCIVAFAARLGIISRHAHFWAVDGTHEATLMQFHAESEESIVSLKMNDVSSITRDQDHFILDTGSPHYVEFVSDLAKLDVRQAGAKIRNSEPFHRKGINVNFAERTGPGTAGVRTYERGVEDETWSCGTGVTAVALVMGTMDPARNLFHINTPGGNLQVSFERSDEGFSNIFLEGPAAFIFDGTLTI